MTKPELRVAYMKALADTKDRSIGAKAYFLRRLWRSSDPEVKQAARVALNLLRIDRPSKRLAIAKLVRAELMALCEDVDNPKRGKLMTAYGNVAKRTGKSDRTIKEYYEKFRALIPEIEAKEEKALIEAKAKTDRDATFYESVIGPQSDRLEEQAQRRDLAKALADNPEMQHLDKVLRQRVRRAEQARLPRRKREPPK